jgi:hypothetical protein
VFIGVLGINIALLVLHPYGKPIISNHVSTDAYILGTAQKELVQFEWGNLIYAFKFIGFLCIGLVVHKLTTEEKKQIVCRLASVGKVYMIYSTLEFFLKNVFQSAVLYQIQNVIFGVAKATTTTLGKRGWLYTLQGLTREPSHFALQLVLIILLFWLQERITGRNNKAWIVLACFYMVAGMSLTSILCVLTVFCFIYFQKENSAGKTYFVMGTIALLVLGILLFIVFQDDITGTYYGKRLVSLISELPGILQGNGSSISSGYISNKARMASVADGLSAFRDNFLFGTGIGTSGCQADFIANLEGLGMVGMISWLCAAPFGNGIRNEKYKWAVAVGFLPYLLVFSESLFWTMFGMAYFLAIEMLFGDYPFSVGELRHRTRGEK